MKKLSYLFILVASLMLGSCNDINTLVPTVSPLNMNWNISHIIDQFQAYTTVPIGNRFTSSFNKSTNEITIINIIEVDSKCEMYPSAFVTNNGTKIDITYTDRSPVGSISVGTKKNVWMKHVFQASQVGKGTGVSIPVVIHYVYPNPTLGGNINDFQTLNF